MSAKLQIEQVSMSYDDGKVTKVRVDYSVRGEVLRSGRGTLELSAKEYEGNESVSVLEGLIRDALIAEVKELADEEDTEENDEEKPEDSGD